MSVERVLVLDAGQFTETDVIVRRRIDLRVSCSCWKHRLPFPVEMIETLGGLYFRPGATVEMFREIGMNGPITIEVASIVKEA